MNFSILNAFIEDQRKAKWIVSERLGVPQDMDALQWALRQHFIYEAYRQAPFAEIYRPHGYGLELKIGPLHIDFDYSEEGRADGFDAWRLFIYTKKGVFDNRGPDGDLCDQVTAWVEELDASGRAIHPDNLYYLVEV